MEHQLQVESPVPVSAPPSPAPEAGLLAPVAPLPLASVPDGDAGLAPAIGRLGIMRKLSVGAADDAAERDADAKADLAVAALFGRPAGHVGRGRRQDSGAEQAGDRITRRAEVGWAGGDASADLESTIGRLRGGGTPIAATVRRRMEDALDADLSSVRVHSGSESRRVNDRLSARAFTIGSDVFFGEREPDVDTAEGAHLYAHELAHVVQQRPQLRRQTLETGGVASGSAPGPAADGPHQDVVAFLEEGAAEAREPEDVSKLLAAAKLKFGLDDILFDSRDPDQPMVGLVFADASSDAASSGTGPTIRREVQGTNGWWFVGNILSDWLIWGGYRAYAGAESLVRSNAITQHSQSKVRYGPLTSRGFATYMMADPLTKHHPKGSQPNATNDTWKILKRRRQKNSPTSASYYIRAHLLNDNLGGPGDDWSNLTVLSQRSNNHSPNGHLKAVETGLKTNVSAGTHAYAYEVTANYGRSVTSWGRWIVNALNYVPHWDAAVRELWAAEDHIPVSFSTRVWKYENGAKHLQSYTVEQMQVGKTEEEDDYFVKVDNQPMLNLKDKSSLVIQALVAGGAGVLGGLSVMAVRPMFDAYLRANDLSADTFGAAHHWDYAAMAVALGTAIANWNTARANPWPKDRV